jgi:hypothetical protein
MVYTVIVHDKGPANPKRFVFAQLPEAIAAETLESGKKLNASQRKELEASFGKDYEKVLQLKNNPTFVQDRTVLADDTIDQLFYKILESCAKHEDSVYMWCKRRVSDKDIFLRYVLKSIFNTRIFVAKSEIFQFFEFLTGKRVDGEQGDEPIDVDHAYEMLAKQDVRYIFEPLGFKYFQNDAPVFFPVNPVKTTPKGYEYESRFWDAIADGSKTLEAHDPYKNTIYCATRGFFESKKINADFYLRLVENQDTRKFYKDQFKTMRDILEKRNDEMQGVEASSITQLQLRVAQNAAGDSVNEDMNFMFAHFQPDETCPFVKYTSMDGVVFKMFKPAINDTSTLLASHIKKWTKVENNMYTARKNETISFKIYLGKHNIIPYFGTVVLYPFGIYDVRLSFSIQDTVNNAFIKRALDTINATVISKIQGLAPVDSRVLNGIQRDSSTSITRMSVNSALKIAKKTVTLEGFAGNALKYNPCFSVLSVNKSYVQLAYRRISEYASPENIMIFINKNMTFKTVKEQIVKRVSMVFGIPLQQALDYVNEYNALGSGDQDAFMNRNMKKGYRGALFRILNVKVSLGNGGSVRIFMDGVTNVAYKTRVEEYLRMILSESSSSKKNAAEIVDDEDVLKLLNDLDLDSEMGGDDSDEDMLDEEFKKLLENAVAENVDQVEVEDKEDHDVKINAKDKGQQVKYDFPIFKYVHEHDDDPIVSKVVNAVVADAKNKRSGETLTDLEKNDPQLFQTVPGEKNYSTLCQMTHKSFPRQPVSVRPEEFFEMKKQYPKATRNWIAYGSDEEHARRNIYFCPDVWCPTSRIAMSGKDYEAKGCPLGKEETPIMYYNAELTKGKKVYVGLMKNKGKTSFRHACFPCCYLRAPKDKAECAITDGQSQAAPVKEEMTLNERHAFSDKQRYIMKDKMVPLPESRYGLLTPVLSKFFGNDKDALGTGADGAGHMSKKTNAFLRVGINYKRQSFLECIAHLLNNDKIKTAEDIVNVIAKNIRVEHFVALQGGLLIKRFWSWNKSDVNMNGGVEYQGEYNKFRTWFLAQESYVEKCGLKYLHDIIWIHTSFGQKMPYAEHVRREFVIYQTFHRFLEYITDDRVVKTHDVLLHLFTQKMQWLNPTGMNILVFESHPNGNATLSCYSHQPKQIIHTGRPVVMMVKTGAVYEPIYHIKINGVSIDGKYRHDMHQNATVGRIIQYFMNTCVVSKSSSIDNMKIIMACKKLGLDVKYQVSDYDMRAVGVVVKDDLFVPYVSDSPIESTWNVQFIDSMYVNVRPKVTIDEAKKIFKKLGAELGDASLYKSLDSNGHITVGSRKMLVPLKGSTSKASADIWEDDLNVFIRSSSKDPRMDAIDMSNAIENLKLAVRNELIHWLHNDSKKRGKGVLEELEFFRHPSNPIPKEIMRKLLYDQLKEPMTDIVYKSSAPLYTGQFSDGLCQVLDNPINCANQCKMIVTMVNKSIAKRQCKIHVPESLYNMVIAQVLDDLLNPYVKMKIKRINKQVHVDSDVIVFNYQDVEVGRLDRIIEDARDLDVAHLAIQKKREPLDFEVFSATVPSFSQEATLPHINSDETTNIHSTYVKDLKGFEALVVKDYTTMSLYELFTAIYNRIHMGANVTPVDFREMVMHQVVAMWDRDEKETKDELNRNKAFPSSVRTREQLMAWYQGDYSYPGRLELKKMAEIAEVDVFLISRPREGEPDNLRCLTRGDNERSPYVVLLQQMKMIDKKYQRYDIVVNNDKKYLFEMNDFSKNFQTIMTNKCTVYRIKIA